MNKLNICYKYFSLKLLVLISVVLILPSSVLSVQNNKDKALPKIKLKEVIYLDWESDINDIAEKIPGGSLITLRSDNSKVYMLDALLEDFDSQVAKISFQRPKDASGNLHTHRWVSMAYNSIDELNSNFNTLIELVSTYSQNIRYLGNAEPNTAEIKLLDNDYLGGFRVNMRKKDWVFELRVNITRFKRTRIK